jgi:hypothetical protein
MASKLEMEVDSPSETKAEMAKGKKKYEDYEVKEAADTLMKAEEIKGNKELMACVHPHLASKKKAISSISDLRKMAEKMSEEMD